MFTPYIDKKLVLMLDLVTMPQLLSSHSYQTMALGKCSGCTKNFAWVSSVLGVYVIFPAYSEWESRHLILSEKGLIDHLDNWAAPLVGVTVIYASMSVLPMRCNSSFFTLRFWKKNCLIFIFTLRTTLWQAKNTVFLGKAIHQQTHKNMFPLTFEKSYPFFKWC